ncbi:MAG TPA: ABC transporter permease [Candidatus Limnocylindrales bacterium]|nr:ABC transporter permease [Candidatus Limnocylindrales bacterium]
MTASIIGAHAAPVSSNFGRFAGARQLVRKDTTEWVRSKRIWVILATVTTFLVLTAANAWIATKIAAAAAPGEALRELPSLGPTENMVGALTTQIFVLAAIFVAGSLIGRERDSGTLAWIASKPVTRASIWASKWISSTAILSIVGGAIPLAITAAVVTLLYGAPPVEIVIGLAVGLAAVTAFFVTFGLALGTVIPGQAATIATGLTIFALAPMLAAAIPGGMALIPTAMLTWPAAALAGEAMSLATPVVWFVLMAGLAVFSIRRMRKFEL